jgi:UDP-N-acetylglucosamine 2-epimerase (non-hydrolysing)
MKVIHVVGARPNFMKTAPIIREMERHPEFQQLLVHTGQHYDERMSQVFFKELGLPCPDVDLGVGSGSHAAQTAGVMLALEPVLESHRPDWVIVVGDVNSTVAAALVAKKLDIRVAHVEAGLRSFDRTMPEEHNRVLTDHLADLLLTPSRDADANLGKEGIPRDRIHFVGNVMIDTLVRLLPLTEQRPILADLGLVGQAGVSVPYVLVTLHRPSNVDDPDVLAGVLRALDAVAQRMPVVFPIHPRTRKRLTEFAIEIPDRSQLRLVDPLGYLDFLALERQASVVLTDSGGIQEETTYLGVPCLTMRPNTERPITITEGTNRLVPSQPDAIAAAVEAAVMPGHEDRESHVPERWDGKSAARIVEVLRRFP